MFETDEIMEDVQMIKVSSRLQEFIGNLDYTITKINGQRTFGPSATSNIPPPPRGTEVFIGNLPRNMYEEELVPILSKVGLVYNVRLMLDFFGRNRGYAFVSYFRHDDAYAAVKQLNNFTIRFRIKLVVTLSVDNRRLFVGSIPKHLELSEIETGLKQYIDGISDIMIQYESYNPKLNRGFAFVEFKSHGHAAIARRQLSPANLVLWGQQIYVDWAEPEPLVAPEILGKVSKLYLSNLPTDLTNGQLQIALADKLKNRHIILKVHKIQHYAFVHFGSRSDAEEAFHKFQNLTILDFPISVNWARPLNYSKYYRPSLAPNNFCLSVPPAMRKVVYESLALRKNSKIRPGPPLASSTFY